MGFKFLNDISISDIAFEADSGTLEGLFKSAADALVNSMIRNYKDIKQVKTVEFTLRESNLESLFVAFLEKLIFYKDVEGLVFNGFKLVIKETDGEWVVSCKAKGEKLNAKKHELIVDVKAVTMHLLEVEKKGNGWHAQAVLDI
jgi:SHS2 domain-containing protein